MSSISAVMNTAKWALLTHQKSLQVASHNIANVETPGFSRQELILETGMPINSSPGQIGTGVQATQVRRVYDRFLEAQIAKEKQVMSRWQAREGVMSQVSVVFNEAEEGSLNARMTEFWAAWQEVANDASMRAERTNLSVRAQSMVDMFNQIHSNLTDIQHQMDETVLEGLNTVNLISGQIAGLNEKIFTTEEASGQNANDYRDQREQLLKDLSELIDFNSYEGSDGKVAVFVAGGKPIVLENESFSLQRVSVQSYIENLEHIVREMLSAQSDEDWVMLSDLLEYELLPILTGWKEILPLIEGAARKADERARHGETAES